MKDFQVLHRYTVGNNIQCNPDAQRTPSASREKKGKWRPAVSPDLQGRRQQENTWSGPWSGSQPLIGWKQVKPLFQDPGPAQHRATTLERMGTHNWAQIHRSFLRGRQECYWPEEASVLVAAGRGGLGGQGTGKGRYYRKVTSENCKHTPWESRWLPSYAEGSPQKERHRTEHLPGT